MTFLILCNLNMHYDHYSGHNAYFNYTKLQICHRTYGWNRIQRFAKIEFSDGSNNSAMAKINNFDSDTASYTEQRETRYDFRIETWTSAEENYGV